jgi:hypothetical protein
MRATKDNVESEGAKPRDHVHPRHHFWSNAHRDWRVWVSVALMIALIFVYLMTNDLSHGGPGKRVYQPTPEANVP